jgi:hypothetical protein
VDLRSGGVRFVPTDFDGSLKFPRRFKSAAHAQWFLSVHGLVRNLRRAERHLLRAAHRRMLRTVLPGVARRDVGLLKIDGTSERSKDGHSISINLTVPSLRLRLRALVPVPSCRRVGDENGCRRAILNSELSQDVLDVFFHGAP